MKLLPSITPIIHRIGAGIFLQALNASFAIALCPGAVVDAQGAGEEGAALHAALVREAALPVKPAWRPMMLNLAALHGRSILPAVGHFPYPYQSIGPGYENGRIFGHIDLTHERLDTVRARPEHVRNQIRNELAGQQADGMIPGIIWFDPAGKPTWKNFKSFPPIWVVSAEAYVDQTGDEAFLRECLEALRRQIGWFEAKRGLPNGGFYYLDQVNDNWESGMDEGIRYHPRPAELSAAVDACAHVYLLYDHALRWSRRVGEPAAEWERKATALREFIRTELWDEGTGFFYDAWVVRDPAKRHLAFEGMWPVVVGAATSGQAQRVIDEHLLNPREFFTPHPIATVAVSDPRFELRMWRGPAWNCMTYWAARGCWRYDRADAARRLLEAALDATAVQFERTGSIWEFYHPLLGDQGALQRKPTARKDPCRDYIGHNPLFAMTDLWRKTGGSEAPAGREFEQAGVVQQLPVFAGRLAQRTTHPLAWASGPVADFDGWRQLGRKKVLDSLQNPPPAAPWNAVVIAEEDRGSYVARKIVFNVSGDSRVLALMTVPKGPGPFPAVLLLHDHGARFDIGKEKVIRPFATDAAKLASAEQWVANYGGRFLGDELAQRGYVCFSTDALNWSDRGGGGYGGQSSLASNLMHLGMSFAGLIAWEDLRAAEFLAGQPEVERGRIAAIGWSLGAFRAWQVAAMSDHIAAGAAVCWMSEVKSVMTPGNNHTLSQSAFTMLHPGLFDDLDYPDIASLACPKPMLFFNGRKDSLFPVDGVERAYAKMQAVWDSQAAGDRLVTKLWNTGHTFDAAMQAVVFDWLKGATAPPGSPGR
jgi:dienelactone hydrolase